MSTAGAHFRRLLAGLTLAMAMDAWTNAEPDQVRARDLYVEGLVQLSQPYPRTNQEAQKAWEKALHRKRLEQQEKRILASIGADLVPTLKALQSENRVRYALACGDLYVISRSDNYEFDRESLIRRLLGLLTLVHQPSAPPDNVSNVVMSTLGALKAEEAIPELIKRAWSSKTADDKIRRGHISYGGHALAALHEIGEPAIGPMMALVDETTDEQWRSLAYFMGGMPNRAAILRSEALARLAQTRSHRSRRRLEWLIVTGLLGDLDGDAAVTPLDLVALTRDLGPCDACVADLDFDGDVDRADATALIQRMGWRLTPEEMKRKNGAVSPYNRERRREYFFQDTHRLRRAARQR